MQVKLKSWSVSSLSKCAHAQKNESRKEWSIPKKHQNKRGPCRFSIIFLENTFSGYYSIKLPNRNLGNGIAKIIMFLIKAYRRFYTKMTVFKECSKACVLLVSLDLSYPVTNLNVDKCVV